MIIGIRITDFFAISSIRLSLLYGSISIAASLHSSGIEVILYATTGHPHAIASSTGRLKAS